MNNFKRMFEINDYLKTLTEAFPCINEIWLLGSRANGTARYNSDWDLLVVGDNTALVEISSARDFKHACVDLMVIDENGDEFQDAWGGDNPKRGSLSGWFWRRISDREAEYLQAKKPKDGSGWYRSEMIPCRALRLWP